jgi:hypothetical protein
VLAEIEAKEKAADQFDLADRFANEIDQVFAPREPRSGADDSF